MNKSIFKIKAIVFLKLVFGELLIDKLLARKYIESYKINKVVFVHIPKAAGTSIGNAIYGKRNGHLKANFIKQKLGEQKYGEKYSFSVTRNPYDRLVSAYNFARQGKTKDGAIAHPEYYKHKVFNTFESFIKNWLAKQDLNNIDPVFQPQYTFVYDEKEQLIVDDLFKLDEMTKVEKKLSEQLNKKVEIQKKNVTVHQQKSVYTDALKEIVFKLYKKDFELLGYDK